MKGDRAAMTEAALDLCRAAACSLAPDVLAALRRAHESERDPRTRRVLGLALRNAEAAAAESLPLCEDRGTPVFFLAVSDDLREEARTLLSAVRRAARHALAEGYLGGPARLVLEGGASGGARLGVLVQGRACRGVARCSTLVEGEGEEGVARRVLAAVRGTRERLCPPLVLGVGLGQSRSEARLEALKALTAPLDDPPSPMEARLLRALRSGCPDLPLLGLRVRGQWPARAVAIEFLCQSARRREASLPLA